MEYRHIFADADIAEEFLDRYTELAGGGVSAGFESLDGGLDSLDYSVDDAAKAVKDMRESTGAEVDPGLEAIILRFGRPAYFVQDNTFNTDRAPSTSAVVDSTVNAARAVIEAAIPSIGRINLRNHRAPWVGTGWVVAPDVLVTNRHVASAFAEREGEGFVFVEDERRRAKAYLDTYREHRRSEESIFRLKKVLWIEPRRTGHPDVAFLSIAPANEDDEPQPRRIELMAAAEYDALPVESWTAVIGYPAFSPYNDAQDQQRIFEGVFNVKRLQPGLITAKQSDLIQHDATTLGGNSGSVVVDLASGKAMALHYGGIEGETNKAVSAPVVARLLQDKVG